MDREFPFDSKELKRYSRNLLVPEVGYHGQKKIKETSVLIVGVGGLGAPAAYYLAAAGIGRLGLVDFDEVELTNLQRQILYTQEDIGKAKVTCAKKRLTALNSYVDIECYNTRLSSENALEILKNYDIVLDGTDNFPTRYLLNDACHFLGIPLVYGSIYQFEGQVSLFYSKKGSCYRCLFPTPPPPNSVPSCSEGGVLGVVPGVIGSLQATEVLNFIRGEPSLIGRMLLVDCADLTFRDVLLRKKEECKLCGTQPTVSELIDYEEFCATAALSPDSQTEESPVLLVNIEGNGKQLEDITPTEAAKQITNGENIHFVDVRNNYELEISKIEPSSHVPSTTFERNLEDAKEILESLSPDTTLVFYCRTGKRSRKSGEMALNFNLPNRIYTLKGGINAWSEAVDDSLIQY